jgi:hypothetical protein
MIVSTQYVIDLYNFSFSKLNAEASIAMHALNKDVNWFDFLGHLQINYCLLMGSKHILLSL